MAQNAQTVFNPNPSPPTNFGSTGVSGPNPPNFQRQNYANPFNLSASGQPQAPYGVNPNPPPYYDDGAAGSLTVFAANVAALTAGTSANDTGTGTTISTAATGAGGSGVNSVAGTYAGAGTPGTSLPYNVGPVPASTSVAAEGAGTETLNTQTYNAVVYNPAGPLLTVGSGPAQTAATIAAGPNASHASSLSPAINPVLSTVTPATAASGSGTVPLTNVAGTNFTPQSIVYANGVAIPTVFVTSIKLTATLPKKATAGTWPITVVTGGAVTTTAQTFTFT